MKKLIILSVLLFFCGTLKAQDEQIPIFKWTLKPTIAVPWGRIEQAQEGSKDLSARLIAAIAGGATLGKYVNDYQVYGFSGLLILDAIDGKDTSFSPSVAITLNLFNHKLQLGPAYNFGKVRDGISKFYLVFSIGIKLSE